MDPPIGQDEAKANLDERPRRRADWEKSRRKILDAAAVLFARQGYRRTGTAEIAQEAGVVEATLFRHFPTKAQLFEQAVIDPFRETVNDLAEARRRRPRDVSTEDAAYSFYDEILRVLRRDSRLLVAALSALTFEEGTEEFSRLTEAFSELLAYMDEVMAYRTVERDFRIEQRIAARTMLAVALGFALGEQLLFEKGSAPTREQLASELARFTAFGLPGHPPEDD